MGSIVSVNIGTPRTVAFRGREITTSIYKNPIEGRVRVFGVNIDGDDQADRTVHGGTDKAVYGGAISSNTISDQDTLATISPQEASTSVAQSLANVGELAMSYSR